MTHWPQCVLLALASLGTSLMPPQPAILPERFVAVRLAWDASPDVVTGYRVHWGPASGVYTNTMEVGDVLTATVSVPSRSETFFVVTALNGSEESDPSNEVSWKCALKTNVVVYVSARFAVRDGLNAVGPVNQVQLPVATLTNPVGEMLWQSLGMTISRTNF